jgi:hypothetical protein
MGNVIRTVDYSPLTDAVPPAALKAFRDAKRGDRRYSTASAVVQTVVLIIAILFMGMLVLGFVSAMIFFVAESVRAGSSAGIGALVFALLFVGFFGLVIVLALRGVIGAGGRWERWYRLDGFAAANGLSFSPIDADPQYPGSIFGSGRARLALDHLRSATDRFLDYGNYRYTTGSGKNSTTHNWGFLALQLDRSLPHMVLDAKANNGLFGGSNLPATFSKDQVLSLEGDFDNYFTLYCPKQYERDALYVFTPDLMALLIDNASPFDVEIVDRWMFVYSAAAFDLRQPATHQRLLRIVDTVGGKTLTQTDRYSDERIGDFTANVVAPQGQRLKRGISVGAIIFLVLFGVIFVGPFLMGVLGALSGR